MICKKKPFLSLTTPFPCSQPVLSSEHMAALGVFGLCQIHAFVDYLRSKLNPQQFEILFRSVISLVGFVLLTIGAVLMLTGSPEAVARLRFEKPRRSSILILDYRPRCGFRAYEPPRFGGGRDLP